MEKKIHLQGVGKVKAIEAGELEVGVVLMWNYGVTSRVLDIKPRGKTQLVITEAYESCVCDRILGRNRLVAVV